MVVELVKKYKKAVTLAIGDGANDVSMIKSELQYARYQSSRKKVFYRPFPLFSYAKLHLKPYFPFSTLPSHFCCTLPGLSHITGLP